jgi:hypothetical protein
MPRLRHCRHPAFARTVRFGLVVAVALLAAGAGGGAGQPRRQKVPAHFVYFNTSQGDSCGWGIGIEFGSVSGAESYTVSYWKAQETGSATSAQLAQSDTHHTPTGTYHLSCGGRPCRTLT